MLRMAPMCHLSVSFCELRPDFPNHAPSDRPFPLSRPLQGYFEFSIFNLYFNILKIRYNPRSLVLFQRILGWGWWVGEGAPQMTMTNPFPIPTLPRPADHYTDPLRLLQTFYLFSWNIFMHGMWNLNLITWIWFITNHSDYIQLDIPWNIWVF